MKKKGFAWHVHHDILLERCRDYEERVRYIKAYKPQEEQELRLRLFQLIPVERLPQSLVKAEEACDKAEEAYNKAEAVYVKARVAFAKEWDAFAKARAAYAKEWEAYKPEIAKLHEELCPNCPWNGETIFTKSATK